LITRPSPRRLPTRESIARRFIDVAAFADQCVERAGGNPLFLEQLLRGAGDLTDGRLPSSIQKRRAVRTDLLLSRPPRHPGVSVLGQRRLTHLRALLQSRSMIAALARNVPVRRTQDGLQFAHALVRDGVYGSLTNARKQSCIGAAAAIFIDDPVLRAEHLDRSSDSEPRAYLGAPRRGRFVPSTRRCWRHAAWRSRPRRTTHSNSLCSWALFARRGARHRGTRSLRPGPRSERRRR
jgi:hypothetical protein